jgi:hypothetical protein
MSNTDELTDDPHEEGPVCDFCNLPVEPDEKLEPIYVGEVPQPDPHHLRAIERKNRRTELMTILGHRGESFIALYKAIEGCQDIDLDISNVVHKVESTGGGEQLVTENELMETRHSADFKTRRDKNKVGVTLTIHPKDMDHEPDAKVCDTCADSFRSM